MPAQRREGQNRSNDDLMTVGAILHDGIFGDDTFLSIPPWSFRLAAAAFGQNDVTLHSLCIVWCA